MLKNILGLAAILGFISVAQICHANVQAVNTNVVYQTDINNFLTKVLAMRAENYQRFSPENDRDLQEIINTTQAIQRLYNAGARRRLEHSLNNLRDQVTLFSSNFQDLDDRYQLLASLENVEQVSWTRLQ